MPVSSQILAYPIMQNAIATTLADGDSLIRNHERLIRHLATRFLGSGASLDDLMQEGRIALWTAEKSWRKESSLWTYARTSVFASMLRCASDYLAEAHAPLDEETVGEDSLEVNTLVRECLAALNEEERDVVRLVMSGETFEQIGSLLRKSDRSVRRIFDGAIATMRERAK